MQTLIRPEEKLKIASLDNSTFQVEEKSSDSKIGLNFRFYQNLFLILLSSCAFLIFPEFPQDSEVICRKFNPKEVCIVW